LNSKELTNTLKTIRKILAKTFNNKWFKKYKKIVVLTKNYRNKEENKKGKKLIQQNNYKEKG
jgi:hypothetical protein